MSRAYMRVLILSPHRDDAAFSCGLLAVALLRRGAALSIANVCTTSDYAPYLQPDASPRAIQVSTERAAEDERFFTALAAHAGVDRAQISQTDLKWSDAPIRLSVPPEAVLVEDTQADEINALSEAFQHLPRAEIVLAPLALGGHLDHRLVREAAILAFPEQLCFYEDLPYAARMSDAERDAEIHILGRDLQPWNCDHLEPAGTKRTFAMHYPSQIAPDVADEMERYARERGNSETLYLNEEMKQLLIPFEGAAR